MRALLPTPLSRKEEQKVFFAMEEINTKIGTVINKQPEYCRNVLFVQEALKSKLNRPLIPAFFRDTNAKNLNILCNTLKKHYTADVTNTFNYVVLDEMKAFFITCMDIVLKLEKLKHKILNSNIRFVVYYVDKYFKNDRVPKDELIQEGCLALMRALDTYNTEAGVRFILWAKFWIRDHLVAYFSQKDLLIRVPRQMYTGVNKLNNLKQQLTHIGEGDINIDALAKKISRTEGEASYFKEGYSIPVSINTPLSADGFRIIDTLKGTSDSPQLDLLERAYDMALLNTSLKCLSKKELMVVKMRWGLSTDDPKTFSSIGETLGVSKQYIEQISSQAIRKLKQEINKDTKLEV